MSSSGGNLEKSEPNGNQKHKPGPVYILFLRVSFGPRIPLSGLFHKFCYVLCGKAHRVLTFTKPKGSYTHKAKGVRSPHCTNLIYHKYVLLASLFPNPNKSELKISCLRANTCLCATHRQAKFKCQIPNKIVILSRVET